MHEAATAGATACPPCQGRLGLPEDATQAATWYAAVADNGHLSAVMHLVMLYAAHPEVPREHDGAGEYLDALLHRARKIGFRLTAAASRVPACGRIGATATAKTGVAEDG